MAHKEIFELIKKNLAGLNSIGSLVDEDLQKEVLNFLPQNDWELKMKLLSKPCPNIPPLDRKFGVMLENFIEHKENEKVRQLYLSGKFFIDLSDCYDCF